MPNEDKDKNDLKKNIPMKILLFLFTILVGLLMLEQMKLSDNILIYIKYGKYIISILLLILSFIFGVKDNKKLILPLIIMYLFILILVIVAVLNGKLK